MKLNEGFITYDSDEDQIMVAVGEAADQFHGLVRSNKMASYIINYLKQDTTEEQIVDTLLVMFDVSRDVVTNDVHKIITDLRQIGAIHD